MASTVVYGTVAGDINKASSSTALLTALENGRSAVAKVQRCVGKNWSHEPYHAPFGVICYPYVESVGSVFRVPNLKFLSSPITAT